MQQSVVLVTGAGTGIGQQSVQALARAGHIVYASLRDIGTRNAAQVLAIREFAGTRSLDIRVVELDVTSDASVKAAVGNIIEAQGRIDAVVHNAAQLGWGVTEAFTPEQIAALFDVNTLGSHRVNRAVLPHMRKSQRGLLLYIGSTTTRMIYPMQGPYEATKASMDSLAEATKYEVARWGIEVVILTPGAIMKGTEHFEKALKAGDQATEVAYDRIAEVGDQITRRLVELSPPESDSCAVGQAVARIVDLPAGTRPFRPMVDFLYDGAEEVNAVAAVMQARLLERLGVGDLLRPKMG